MEHFYKKRTESDDEDISQGFSSDESERVVTKQRTPFRKNENSKPKPN